MSEFYRLRRTTIKDVSGYAGFIIGFFGSAPFAWPYLVAQAEDGDFTRGVWHFLLIIGAGAIVCAGIGLVFGAGIGWVWERLHRLRRGDSPVSEVARPPHRGEAALPQTKRQGGDGAPPLGPEQLVGRRLDSVTFRTDTIELGFGGPFVRLHSHPTITTGGVRHRLSETGGRDALCALIGATVDRMDLTPGRTIQVHFADGSSLSIPISTPDGADPVAAQVVPGVSATVVVW
ncbi:MAG TPA: hypothetical protein VMM18_01695 [Gemmatimonadaceae bacterium]|nr:hypothetical protein [Gemmatimonadaceae bacterium]